MPPMMGRTPSWPGGQRQIRMATLRISGYCPFDDDGGSMADYYRGLEFLDDFRADMDELAEMGCWLQADGQEIKYTEMETQHLINAVRMLDRRMLLGEEFPFRVSLHRNGLARELQNRLGSLTRCVIRMEISNHDTNGYQAQRRDTVVPPKFVRPKIHGFRVRRSHKKLKCSTKENGRW